MGYIWDANSQEVDWVSTPYWINLYIVTQNTGLTRQQSCRPYRSCQTNYHEYWGWCRGWGHNCGVENLKPWFRDFVDWSLGLGVIMRESPCQMTEMLSRLPDLTFKSLSGLILIGVFCARKIRQCWRYDPKSRIAQDKYRHTLLIHSYLKSVQSWRLSFWSHLLVTRNISFSITTTILLNDTGGCNRKKSVRSMRVIVYLEFLLAIDSKPDFWSLVMRFY